MGSVSFLSHLLLLQRWCLRCLPRTTTLPLVFHCIPMTALPGMLFTPGHGRGSDWAPPSSLHDGCPVAIQKRQFPVLGGRCPLLDLCPHEHLEQGGEAQTDPWLLGQPWEDTKGGPSLLLFRSKHLPVFKQLQSIISCHHSGTSPLWFQNHSDCFI